MGTVVELLLYAAVAAVCYLGWILYRDFQSARGRDLLVDVDEEGEELQRLAALKTRLLQDIKGLEFDFDTGHLTEADYKQLRARLEKRAIGAMKKLDRLRGNADFDSLIDAELDARDQGHTPRRRPAQADTGVADGLSPLPCSECGHNNHGNAKFCAECGQGLALDCRVCKTRNRLQAKFCKGCGESLVEEVAA